ncbi:MAG: antibiotic biosynthesis monooxygenase [Acetobacteraceae bacterium]|nr:antibiotic biosynthesis monooxygenase [Acetobacteraceae bacterium]
MADGEVNVVATFKAKGGQAQAVRQALEKMVEPTRAEQGNVGYDLHEGVEDEDTFVLYEQWRSKPDLDAHMQKPYFKQMDQDLSGILQQPYTVTLLKHIAGGHAG